MPRNLQLQSAPQSHLRHVSEMISSLGLDMALRHDLTDLFNDDIMTCSTCKFEFLFFQGSRHQVLTSNYRSSLGFVAEPLQSLDCDERSGQNPQMACRLWYNDTHSLCVWVQSQGTICQRVCMTKLLMIMGRYRNMSCHFITKYWCETQHIKAAACWCPALSTDETDQSIKAKHICML